MSGHLAACSPTGFLPFHPVSMTLFTLGINHRTAPLAVRELLAFHAEELPRALEDVLTRGVAQEAAILSTCNRTELTFVADDAFEAAHWLAGYRRVDPAALEGHLYSHAGQAAASHVFRVACGLDSMILGEPQILGQMKEAVRQARETATLGTLLHKLYESAFSVAKDVRSSTAIGANIVSLASAAVSLADEVVGPINERNLLFIGAGEMIELCATHFAARQPQSMVVANRTIDRGRVLADRFGAMAVRLEDIGARMADFDIVISCTASQLPIIGLGCIERAMKVRQRPMFIIDLAVPRDVEAEVGQVADVFLYSIDDLARTVASGLESRAAAAADAEAIVATRVGDFMRWLETRETVPVIRALRDSAERMRRHEVEHALKALAHGDDPVTVVDQLAHRLTNKFMHAPTQALNRADSDRGALQTAIARLFNLHHE